MNKAAPWNVRGVGLDTREAAREAARRAGMSLGEWLDSVIAEEADSLGVEAEDIGADDRLDAVTAKLSQMTGKATPARKSQREAVPARPTIRPGRMGREPAPRAFSSLDDSIHDRDYSDAGPIVSRHAEAAPVDPEALLDAAVARIERRSGQAQRQTNAALENVAARLGDIETQMTSRRDDTAIAPIKSALGRLEERIEALSRRPAPPRTDTRVETSLRDLTDRLDDVAQKIDRTNAVRPREPDTSHIQRLDARLSSVLTQLQDSEARRAKAAEAEHLKAQKLLQAQQELQEQQAQQAQQTQQALQAQQMLQPRRPALPLRGIAQMPFSQAVSDIEKRQRDLDRSGPARGAVQPRADAAFDQALDRRLEQIAAHVEKAADSASGAGRASDKAFADLQGEIARLSARLDVRQNEPPKALQTYPELQQLKHDIADMSRAVGELAPRGSVSALETAVRDLSTRIEISRKEGARENLLAPVETLVSDLHATLKHFDPRQPIVDLEREIKTIGKKVETMTLAGFDPDAFRRIHSQSQEIRDLLTAAASRPLPFDRLEKQIAALGTRVDHLAQNQAPAAQPDVSTAIGEIRTLVDRAMVDRAAPGQYIATLEKRLESLAQKIDQAVARPLPTATVLVPDTSGLERMIARLAERVEATRKTTQDPQVFETLQHEIARIGQRLDTSDAGFKTLGTIERSISELFDGLEATRVAAISAAETAARLAATDAAEKATRSSLREAMQNLPQQPEARAQSQAIQRDLLDIRAEQEAASKRGHATLNAVHGTLEKIVDRLATLETSRPSAAPTYDETRSIAMEVARSAATEAASHAARASLHEAMQSLPQQPAALAQSQAIQRDLLDIRAEQEAASKRGHATLNAVHGTLEKIVDRLATLETSRPSAAPTYDETLSIAMEVARSAATEAASLAARASLHEAMQNLPQQPEARAQSQAIQRDLLDIRAEQEAASKRGHSTLNAVHGTLEKIVDRLATLETSRPEVHGPSLEDTRNIAMEAARNAARETFQEIRDQSPAASDNQDSDYIKRDLADLRHAQEEAGERTHSTLKAVHQTLERVVDRLATLEDEKTATPFAALQAHNHGAAQGQPEVSDRSHAAPVFAPAPRRFDMSVDVETLRPRASPRSPEPAPAAAGRRQSQTAPAAPGAGLQDADGLEMLLEPGSGLPPHRGAGPTIQAANKARLASETVQSNSVTASAGETVGGQPNSFIAAARRAAQAAAAEVTAERQSPTPRIDRVADTSSVSNFPPANSAGVLASATTFMRVRKKPILIGLTGLVVVLGAAMISRTFIAGPAYVQKVEIVPQDYGNTNVTAAVADPVAPVAAVAATLSPAAPNSVAEVPAAPAADAPVPLVRMLSPRVGRQATLPPGTIAGPSGTAGPIAMAIPGDVASHGLPKARPQVATAVPILPIAPQAAIGAVPAPSGVDQNPVGSIDGKPNAAALPTPTGVSTLLRTAALAGSAAAQYEIGMRYAEGRGVTRDLKIAAQWFEQSANIGLAPAQYRIGSLYEKGLGVAKDNAAAKNWYQKAAEGGNIRAMHNLAVLTAEGTDGKPDYANAAQWFKKAAEHGVRDSQYNLAILYARGLGIEQNLAQSYIWFAVAAALGDEDASKKRDEVAGKLDAKALAAARAGVEAFHPMVPNVASNDVPPPAGGWDGTPQKTELGVKMPNKV